MHALIFNFVFHGLAAWAVCCVVKALLDFIPLKKNPLQNLLNHIASPILKVTKTITPALIPKTLHIFLATIWLLTARLGFFMLAGAYGWLPPVTS